MTTSTRGKNRNIILINPNLLKPPISPVGLEYIAETLSQAGHHITWIDLCFSDNWQADLKNILSNNPETDYIGITIRNLDEAMMGSQTFFLNHINHTVQLCRNISNAPIFLGGAGFSIAPAEILNYTHADYGLIGNGVNLINDFLTAIDSQSLRKFPACVYKDEDGTIIVNPLNKNYANNKYSTVTFHRNYADIERYFREGGQIGIETKRGCSQQCIYCVEGTKENNLIELREPKNIVFEIEQLLNKGISVFHWCDSEFNIPVEHAFKVCNEFVQRGINKEIKWYTYCAPVPFPEELAVKMEAAGCAGINFGIDSLHPAIIRMLHRQHTYKDIEKSMKSLRKTNIAVMFDLLIGVPGETIDSALFTIEHALKLKPDVIGISLGVRIYPHTIFGKNIISQQKSNKHLKENIYGKPVEENPDLLFPIYYLSKDLDKTFFNFLLDLTKNEPSVFLSLPATEEGSYSYCNHDYLIQAIRNGARGAYWDILRKRNL
ncbi:MAG TPA: radical SAM protein [Candidatus Hydrogenedens sp.]|nr:radical SAM protein [Candidatus Hydrogenedens sp.]